MMRIRFFIYLLFGIMWRGLVPAFAQQSNGGMEISLNIRPQLIMIQ